MPNCCYGDEYNSMFNPTRASGVASRFLRKGLQGVDRTVVSALNEVGQRDMSLLEVGGGVGQIQVALLENGIASRAYNVELSNSWEDAARKLLIDRGLVDRVVRIVGDFVDQTDQVPRADLVVLQRVVCCYPDWRNLLEAAMGKADRLMAMTFPDNKRWIRWGFALGNVTFRFRGRSFRAFVHPPPAMLELLAKGGFSVVHDQSGTLWRTVIAQRERRSALR